MSVVPADPTSVATGIAELAASRPATLGDARLVCVDGPGGSGKTTLAAALAELVPGAVVVHMDDLYDGWSGMRAGADQLGPLLHALATGHAGTYRRYDWDTGEFAETVAVDPAPLLVLEGVGCAGLATADLVTVLVWVWVPAALRLARGLERDGEHLREQWAAWMHDEDDLFARERTRQRAHVLVDGTGHTTPVLAPTVTG